MSETIKIRVNPDINTLQSHSKFTKQNLLDLNNPAKAYISPLSTIAHVDVNAFFAQVEQIRTNLSPEDPVVCVQWTSLIAVSYAARDYGIGRMDNLETARLKCSELKPIHTATFKKGENFWRYRDEDDKFPSPVNHKVSLDPYRRESRKLMSIFKKNCDLVEKASVDESFMELGRLILVKLFELMPDFKINELEKDDHLPNLPTDFELTTYGHIIKPEGEELFMNDYDDLFIILGSIVTHEIRKEIEDSLGYTTSCGISQTKTVAKLASGFKKPNNQTIVLPSQTFKFLNNFELTDFWSMGGKTGEFLKLKLIPEDDENDNSIHYIKNHYSLSELKILLDDDKLAVKLFDMVRGKYKDPVVSRIQLKSMNSSKNMRGRSCEDVKDCKEWIKIFAVDLYQRLIEIEDELAKKIRPKTISMSIRPRRNFKEIHSKQMPISNIYSNNDELEEIFYAHGNQLIQDLRTQHGPGVFPLSNLNMTISNFEILDKNFEVNNIMNFVKKGDLMDGFKDFEKQREKENDIAINAEDPKNKEFNEAKKAKNLEVINSLFKDFKSKNSTPVEEEEEEEEGQKDEPKETTHKVQNLEPVVKDVRMKDTINKAFEEFQATQVKEEPSVLKSLVKKEPFDAFKNFKKIDKIEHVFKKFKPTRDKGETTDDGVIVVKDEPDQIQGIVVKAEKFTRDEIPKDVKPSIKSEFSVLDSLKSIPVSSSSSTTNTSTSQNSSFTSSYEITDTEIICKSCGASVEDIEEHDDYHYALNLSKSFSEDIEPSRPSPTSLKPTTTKKRAPVNSHKRAKLAKGQSKLPF